MLRLLQLRGRSHRRLVLGVPSRVNVINDIGVFRRAFPPILFVARFRIAELRAFFDAGSFYNAGSIFDAGSSFDAGSFFFFFFFNDVQLLLQSVGSPVGAISLPQRLG